MAPLRHLSLSLSLIAGLVVVPTPEARAASSQLIEYIHVAPGPGGTLAFSEGDRPISSARFLQAIEHLNAAPGFTEGIHRERATRTTLVWSSVGLATLVPVLGTMFVVNNQRNPSGSITRTWLIASLADAAAAAGVGLWAFIRNSQPLYTEKQATGTAQAYNRKLDELATPHTRP